MLSKQVYWGKLCFGYLMFMALEELHLIDPALPGCLNSLPKETLFIGFYYS